MIGTVYEQHFQGPSVWQIPPKLVRPITNWSSKQGPNRNLPLIWKTAGSQGKEVSMHWQVFSPTMARA